MGTCDFSAVFSEICNNIIGGENISQVEIYSSLFDSYYRTHNDDFFSLDKSDINFSAGSYVTLTFSPKKVMTFF